MSVITPIGRTNWRGMEIPFGIKPGDKLGHIYCIGKTGTGKSSLLLNMAISDIRQGYGVGVIDPHGDLSTQLLDFIPKERIKDVIYFNPGDVEYPIGFNPLSNVSEEDRYMVTASIVTALKMLFNESWGPRLEHILRFSILTLLSFPHATLLDIQPLLTDYEFRKKVLLSVTDSTVLDFWFKEFQPLTPQLKGEFISPIINKLGLFSTHPLLRNIVGQYKTAFSVLDIMNSKKVFIANLAKGHLGEAGTQFLGSLLVSQFQIASLQRIHIPIENRVPFYLYVDEMHSFVTLSFADILSESRKFGLGLFLTHQFIDQLKEELRKAILGNVGTLISFRVGAADAQLLEMEFTPTFLKEDLIGLPKYHIYLKLMIDGATSHPFSATTNPLPVNKTPYKEQVVKLNREKYAVRKDEIESQLNKSRIDHPKQMTLL